MADVRLLSYHPRISAACYLVNGTDHRFCMGIADSIAAETQRLAILAEENAKEAAHQQRWNEWDAARAAEWIARAAARVAVAPSAASFLAFLKLVHHKESVPLLDEIRTEIARLDEEEKEALEKGTD